MEIEDKLNLKSELIDELNTRNSKLIVFIENELEKARFGELEQLRLKDMEAAINLSGQLFALQKMLDFVKNFTHHSTILKKKTKHGGKRKGAGRPVTKEPTVVMRIPISKLDAVLKAIGKA